MKKALFALLVTAFLFASAVVSSAMSVTGYWAPFEVGFNDGTAFGQLEISGVEFEVSGWDQFAGTSGFISFKGTETPHVDGILYANNENPDFQSWVRFNDVGGNIVGQGLYDHSNNPANPQWIFINGNPTSYFTLGNFQPISSVPEPASVMLIGAGVIGLVAFKKKR